MIKKALYIYLIYLIIGSVLIFALPKKVSTDYISNSDVHKYYSDQPGEDRVVILDDPLESGLARLSVIDDAQKSLDIAYFAIGAGETVDVFFGALFDAADRGVKVNLLLDGLCHGLRWSKRSIIYAVSNHPNMEIKFYEKFNPLLPWTINNRMHDKYIIADNKVAIIGGRNIGDRYFAPESYKNPVTNDRDALIINFSDRENVSAIDQMSQYFSQIWNHKYSKGVPSWIKRIHKRKSDQIAKHMIEKTNLTRDRYKERLDNSFDIYNKALPTNKVSFIHNPLERFSKEPWCWYELVQLFKGAQESAFIQSPYVIPSRKMMKGAVSAEDLENKDITILTNSLASTPNIPGFSGYQNYRKKIVDQKINVLEVQSVDSIHSKAMVIDDDLVAIGSFNLDARSAFLSTESMVVIYSAEVVKEFSDNIVKYTDKSLLVNRDYKYQEDPRVKEEDVSLFKKALVKILSAPLKLVGFLL